ncbi:MAG: ComF family protein [Syntrophothermus sp.]|uniref:ComF family protein n=1 Tax=Syntrophothermus sp. TaxID=2736299 RepID=UPI00257E7F1D|nr:ComF family protein [Syntrophothermus sp.]NSW83223.1 ComF family protein [Syntrophothermus sp.]
MFEFLFDLVFPHNTCALCRKPGLYWTGRPWCEECDRKLEATRENRPVCDRCGKYLCGGDSQCQDCSEQAPPFFIARAVGPYEKCYKVAVKLLKFMCRGYIAVRMGRMMAEVVKNEPRYWPLDLVIPVPISQPNLMKRGFNQSEVLARNVAKALGLKMLPDVLVRVRETPSQRELTKEERQQNLKGAFDVRDCEKIRGKNILLVDDVYTTGSTAKECATVLLDAGANRVSVITWASGKGF